ncbi:MAG: alanine racemase [Acidobacteria bacterium]|nr:alanine racemase [Acidobacteriota bacterium]
MTADARARVEIDLGALAGNLRLIRRAVGGTGVFGVVKADAYGHGAVAVSLELERLGIDGLAVSRVSEVGELRRSGVRSPLLLLGGPASIEELDRAVERNATPVLTRREQIADWSAWRRRSSGSGTPLGVVVELDTGMSRYGVPLDEWPLVLQEVRSAPELRLAGLMSHLAESELPKSGFTALQEQRFAAAVEALGPEERENVSLHLSNSAGALRRGSARWDAVRVGGALYGLDLASAADPSPASGLRPVMRVVAPILDLRQVPAGTGVGYRRTWKAPRDATIGLVPVGYGDGFSTALGAGDVLVSGVRCPIAGQVSMDSLTVDVTGVPGVMVGDECVLLGSQGDERIEVAELAARAGVAAYEVWCGFERRLPRKVLDPGRPREGGRGR